MGGVAPGSGSLPSMETRVLKLFLPTWGADVTNATRWIPARPSRAAVASRVKRRRSATAGVALRGQVDLGDAHAFRPEPAVHGQQRADGVVYQEGPAQQRDGRRYLEAGEELLCPHPAAEEPPRAWLMRVPGARTATSRDGMSAPRSVARSVRAPAPSATVPSMRIAVEEREGRRGGEEDAHGEGRHGQAHRHRPCNPPAGLPPPLR